MVRVADHHSDRQNYAKRTNSANLNRVLQNEGKHKLTNIVAFDVEVQLFMLLLYERLEEVVHQTVQAKTRSDHVNDDAGMAAIATHSWKPPCLRSVGSAGSSHTRKAIWSVRLEGPLTSSVCEESAMAVEVGEDGMKSSRSSA